MPVLVVPPTESEKTQELRQTFQLLLKNSRSYLRIYSFKQKSAFDVCFDAVKLDVRFKTKVSNKALSMFCVFNLYARWYQSLWCKRWELKGIGSV